MHWIWSEWFWLVPPMTWQDFESGDEIPTPKCSDLLYWPLITMTILMAVRKYVVVPFVLVPLGNYMRVRSKPVSPPAPHTELEKLYKVNRARPPPHLLERCAMETKMTQRQVERWLRKKASSEQKTDLDKFIDYGWEFMYYSSYCTFGLFVIATQPWCYDLGQVMENYPRTPLTPGLFWYLMISLGFYFGQTYILFSRPKRFDFYLMLLHHVCTIVLMASVWVLNLVRYGALTLILHESADIFVALFKLLNYSGKTLAAQLMSIPFCLVWFSTRLVLFPFHVIRGTLLVAPTVVGGTSIIYYFQNGLMLLLVCMHSIWSYEIITAIIRKYKHGADFNERFSPDEMSEEETLPQNEGIRQNVSGVKDDNFPGGQKSKAA